MALIIQGCNWQPRKCKINVVFIWKYLEEKVIAEFNWAQSIIPLWRCHSISHFCQKCADSRKKNSSKYLTCIVIGLLNKIQAVSYKKLFFPSTRNEYQKLRVFCPIGSPKSRRLYLDFWKQCNFFQGSAFFFERSVECNIKYRIKVGPPVSQSILGVPYVAMVGSLDIPISSLRRIFIEFFLGQLIKDPSVVHIIKREAK